MPARDGKLPDRGRSIDTRATRENVMQASTATTAAAPRKPFYTHLYAQVLTAIVLGVLLGYFYPQLGEQMKPLGDGFIKLIKMLIASIIFCMVVHDIDNLAA